MADMAATVAGQASTMVEWVGPGEVLMALRRRTAPPQHLGLTVLPAAAVAVERQSSREEREARAHREALVGMEVTAVTAEAAV
jgi:hypothetical protein